MLFFFNDTATTEIYTYVHTLSLHDALPILCRWAAAEDGLEIGRPEGAGHEAREGVDRNTGDDENAERGQRLEQAAVGERLNQRLPEIEGDTQDRKSTRLNSSH